MKKRNFQLVETNGVRLRAVVEGKVFIEGAGH